MVQQQHGLPRRQLRAGAGRLPGWGAGGCRLDSSSSMLRTRAHPAAAPGTCPPQVCAGIQRNWIYSGNYELISTFTPTKGALGWGRSG